MGRRTQEIHVFRNTRGHLDCLKYAHGHGCPWDNGTTRFAALNDHLECLRFAHKHGCPWDSRIAGIAAAHGHLDCLKYAQENGLHNGFTLTLLHSEK